MDLYRFPTGIEGVEAKQAEYIGAIQKNNSTTSHCTDWLIMDPYKGIL